MKTVLYGFCLCFLALFLLLNACSSDRVTDSPTVVEISPSAGTVSKISISTDHNSPMPTTHIIYEVPQAGYVFLEVTNATGYSVKTLVDGDMEAGAYIVSWDWINEDGKPIEPGIYMLHLGGPDGGTWAPMLYVEP